MIEIENDAEYLEIMRPQIETESGWAWWCMDHDVDGVASDEAMAIAGAAAHAEGEYDDGEPCRVCVVPPKGKS